MFRGRKGWLAVQGWGSKKQKDLFCLKNNMQPLKDHDNDYFIYICESDSQLFNQNFLCFFCFALENDYEDILYRFIFT